MNGFLGLVLCALILTGASQGPPGPKEFNPACALKLELSKEEFDAFNPLDDEWPMKLQCYHECELEQMGALENGEFTEKFKSQFALFSFAPTEELRKLTRGISNCIKEATGEGKCEKAFQYGKCTGQLVFGPGGLAAGAGPGGPQ